MAVVTTATSVPTTGAVQVLGQQPLYAPGTTTVVVSNLGPNSVYLGGPGVTSTTGVQLQANTNLVLPATDPAGMYAVAVTATSTVVVGVF